MRRKSAFFSKFGVEGRIKFYYCRAVACCRRYNRYDLIIRREINPRPTEYYSIFPITRNFKGKQKRRNPPKADFNKNSSFFILHSSLFILFQSPLPWCREHPWSLCGNGRGRGGRRCIRRERQQSRHLHREEALG